MEGGAAATKEESVGSIKTQRSKLESRIESQHNTHLDLLSSLQNLVPDIVPCLDLSLNIISNFNRRNFNPTPPLPEIPKLPPKPLTAVHLSQGPPSANDDSLVRSPETGRDQRAAKFVVGASGSPLAVVRAMVALCLLQRVPFKPIDSSIIARKLESDASLTSSEKKALRDLGGESGTVLAVEIALKSIADENNDGGVELDELSISGKSRVMVLSIDKVRLLKELPESVPVKPDLIEGGGATNQSQGQGEMEMYGFQRPHQDMWDPHVMYGGAAGGGGMMAPRGGRGMTGRGMMNNRQQNLRTEEDDLIDIEEMLNKKTYKESQRSKAGEELLDLIQRPTAKETAVAAKVFALPFTNYHYYAFVLFILLLDV